MSPSTVAIIASLLLLALYAAVGFRKYRAGHSAVSFFLSGRTLGRSEIRNTLAGAAISVSTVLVFFLTIGLSFGWQILISPLTLAAGVVVFRYLVHPKLLKSGLVQQDATTQSPHQIDSLADLVVHLYGSRPLATTVTAIAALGILAILVAELMVGVTVLNAAHVDPIYALFAISLALILYAGLGGMGSVVATDRWQVWIVVFSLVAVLAFLLTQVSSERPNLAEDFLLAGWSPDLQMPLALVVNITVVNLCFLPASLRVWQVVAASSSGTAFHRALWESTGIIVLITICALLIGKSMQVLAPDSAASTDSLFAYLGSTGGVLSYVLYPLFVVAMLSALVSTADSAILPLAQYLHALRSPTFSYPLNLSIISALLALGIGAYFVVTQMLEMSIVNWILTVFSITTVIAPAIVLPLFMGRRTLTKAGATFMCIGLVMSCGVALGWSIANSKDLTVQPWNCALGVGISTVVSVVALAWLTLNPDSGSTLPSSHSKEG